MQFLLGSALESIGLDHARSGVSRGKLIFFFLLLFVPPASLLLLVLLLRISAMLCEAETRHGLISDKYRAGYELGDIKTGVLAFEVYGSTGDRLPPGGYFI